MAEIACMVLRGLALILLVLIAFLVGPAYDGEGW